MKQQINLQDVFLNQVRKEKILITVFLVNGVQIRGLVIGFDNYVVVKYMYEISNCRGWNKNF